MLLSIGMPAEMGVRKDTYSTTYKSSNVSSVRPRPHNPVHKVGGNPPNMVNVLRVFLHISFTKYEQKFWKLFRD